MKDAAKILLRRDLMAAARAQRERPPRLVLVGLCPNKTAGAFRRDSPIVLTGASGRTLASLFGLTRVEYLSQTRRYNVLDHYEQAAPMKLLRAGAEIVAKWFRDGDTVILFGRDTVRAFGLNKTVWMLWVHWRYIDKAKLEGVVPGGIAASVVDSRAIRLAALPHPSPRTAFYRNAKNRGRVEVFLRGLLEDEAEGERQ